MASDPESLHCPNCGAPAEPDRPRCAYCRARLATVACASCYAAMFEGTAFCPRCGAPRTRREAQPSDARCPGCRATLSSVQVGSVALLECAACDGVWLDAADFERVCTDGETRAAVVHRHPAGPSPIAAGRIRYRPCVRCGRMMNRVNFARLSGTIVDVCRGHGTFLDAGELHAIVTFIHDGGLDRMREREVADIEEATRRLAAGQRAAARPRTGREGSTAGWDATSVSEVMRAILGD